MQRRKHPFSMPTTRRTLDLHIGLKSAGMRRCLAMVRQGATTCPSGLNRDIQPKPPLHTILDRSAVAIGCGSIDAHWLSGPGGRAKRENECGRDDPTFQQVSTLDRHTRAQGPKSLDPVPTARP